MSSLLEHLLVKQLGVGAVETLFNGLINRSAHTQPILRKLAGKILEIQLKQPDLSVFIVFSEKRTDWLSNYEGQADCSVQLFAKTLPKLTAREQLSTLINSQELLLNGDLQVLQHFSTLLDELEKDPAEWLSPFIGDVAAQVSTDFAKKVFAKIRADISQQQRYMVENLMNERAVLVHQLEICHFCDEVDELAKRVESLSKRIDKLKT